METESSNCFIAILRIIKKNTAARYKSKLNLRVKALAA